MWALQNSAAFSWDQVRKQKRFWCPYLLSNFAGACFFFNFVMPSPESRRIEVFFTWLHVRPGTFDLSKSKAGEHRKPFARPTHTLQKMQGMPKNTNGMIESHWNKCTRMPHSLCLVGFRTFLLWDFQFHFSCVDSLKAFCALQQVWTMFIVCFDLGAVRTLTDGRLRNN